MHIPQTLMDAVIAAAGKHLAEQAQPVLVVAAERIIMEAIKDGVVVLEDCAETVIQRNISDLNIEQKVNDAVRAAIENGVDFEKIVSNAEDEAEQELESQLQKIDLNDKIEDAIDARLDTSEVADAVANATRVEVGEYLADPDNREIVTGVAGSKLADLIIAQLSEQQTVTVAPIPGVPLSDSMAELLRQP